MSQPNRDSCLLVRQLPATHISYNYGKMPINASADAWYLRAYSDVRRNEKKSATDKPKYSSRAFSYANILKYMGGASLLDHPLELNEKLPSRSSEEETYNHIVGLLDKAAASLPDIRSNSDHGKPSAGACYALKARVAFYAHKYDVAEAAARKVMGMNVYGLYDNYGDLFQPVAELCNEIIFDREYLENPKNSNEGSYIGQFFAPVMMRMGSFITYSRLDRLLSMQRWQINQRVSFL